MRTTRTLASAAAAALTIIACAAGTAQAAPGTVTGPRGLSLTVDNTTPAPGDTITMDWSYTVPNPDPGAGAATTKMGFGGGIGGAPSTVNTRDLSFVSCSGQFSNCALTPFLLTFQPDVPEGLPGDTITGSARFTVSSSATVGETISFSGFHLSSDFTPIRAADLVFTSSALALTVTAPPQADLGVALSASASLLNPRVTYDAAVTNNGPAAATSATITTQLPSQATGISSSSPTCTYTSATDQVSCPIGAIANGATTHATFTATYGLLTIGLPLHATATRTASSPTDPNASNDSDSADCNAITSLLIAC